MSTGGRVGAYSSQGPTRAPRVVVGWAALAGRGRGRDLVGRDGVQVGRHDREPGDVGAVLRPGCVRELREVGVPVGLVLGDQSGAIF